MGKDPVRRVKPDRGKEAGSHLSWAVVSAADERAFDRKVRPRVYHVGDMVLKRILPPQNDRRGKWTPNYEGPFVVKKVFSGGALLLTTMDGEDFPSPVNADAVKKYFV